MIHATSQSAIKLLVIILLSSQTAFSQNTVLGFEAGKSITSGDANVFIGYRAGYLNTSGGQNSFLGFEAGRQNIAGYENTFIGNAAGYGNLHGYYNVFTGSQAGYNNSYGNYNVFTGYGAGYRNTNGYSNAFTGYRAGYYNTTGFNNAFVGSQAGGSNTIGSQNVFIGSIAGAGTTNGSYNSSTGYRAGNSNTTGSNNSFFGALADATGLDKLSLQRATALGQNALVGIDDGLVLGDTVSVKVGIGTAYPNQRLTIRGNINFMAYNNSLQMRNQPFLQFNKHQSLALGLGAEIAPDAESTLVLGSSEAEVLLPGIAKNYLANSAQVLTVDERGKILLTKPRLQVKSTSEWSDKVFEEGYALRPLGEVEDFVKKNKHLPGVPSAEKMVTEGVESTSLSGILLEKIEELTLYVVELEKKNREFEKVVCEIKNLHTQIVELRGIVEKAKFP